MSGAMCRTHRRPVHFPGLDVSQTAASSIVFQRFRHRLGTPS